WTSESGSTKCFTGVMPSLKSSWRGWIGQCGWRRKGCGRRWKCFEGKESPAKISKSVRRDLGRSWRKTPLACGCDQRWKETQRFSDRQGAERAQGEPDTPGWQEKADMAMSKNSAAWGKS